MSNSKSDSTSGDWRRTSSVFRNRIVPVEDSDQPNALLFPAQPKRYHLYAAWNCPWAHRCLVTRKLKHLDDLVSVSYAAPRRDDRGWIFDSGSEFVDILYGAAALRDIYQRAEPGYDGRVTVPLLWDTESEQIVSNESADIIEMFNHAFHQWAKPSPDLYPGYLKDRIDSWNQDIYQRLNNGVYRAGFATTQQAYDGAVADVFACLHRIETQLSKTRYLTGPELSLADIRLFPTLARFDVAYFSAFKCNQKRLIDFPNLWNYAREFYHIPGVAETVRFDIYKQGYFSPSAQRNPHGIIPLGPEIDWTTRQDRPDMRSAS